jgi:hypothetical protein
MEYLKYLPTTLQSPTSVIVSMVNIGKMQMFVCQGSMTMQMFMRFMTVPGKTMLMFVMRVVYMKMSMFQRFMAVHVLMLLCQM